MENKKKIFIAYTAFVLSVLTIIGCIVWFFSVPTYAAPIEPTESVEEIEYITPLKTELREPNAPSHNAPFLPAAKAEEPDAQVETAETAVENESVVTEESEDTVPQNLSENELSIYTALRNAGLSKAGTAAVMGCMSMESGLRTTAENPNDGGYGLLQWTYSRKSDLFNWCYTAGLDATSAEGQVAFLVYELQSKYSMNARYSYPVYETLVCSSSVEDSLTMFFSHMEAGVNVPISASKVYCANLTTFDLYRERLNAAYKYF